MATVMVPVEGIPDDILARYDAVAARVPKAGEQLWRGRGMELACCNFREEICIILRPKIVWPTWFKMQWIYRDREGYWHRTDTRPTKGVACWVRNATTFRMDGLDTSWLPDVPWQESLFENPNWKGE